jgi:hypothetical protein
MKPFIFVYILWVMMAAACSDAKEKTTTIVSADTTSYYSISSYINSQLKYFDSVGATYNVVTIEGTQKDSITVQVAAIRPMIQSFLDADISDSIQKKNYQESVFRDAGTASLNINYTPMDTSTTIKNIDILMDEQTSLVKRIFIRKQQLTSDTTNTEQLSWKTNEGFTISVSKKSNSGFLLNKTTNVRVILP